MSTSRFCISPFSKTSIKHRFTNIQGLFSNFFACEPLLESHSLDILGLSEINFQEPIGFSNFSVRGYLPLIQKDSLTHMLGLTDYVREGICFIY